MAETSAGMLTDDQKANATSSEMTFTFVEGKERGDAAQNYLYGQEGEVQQLTVDELRDYFESDKVNRLPEVFGTFENYLAYMTEREQLIQSGDYDVGNWSEADTGFSQDQEMILEGDADLTIDPSDPGQNLETLRRRQTSTQQGAYNNWINSEANQALLQKYGVAPTVFSGSGDVFRWNGSGYVKVEDVEEETGQWVKTAIIAAMSYYAGGAYEAAGLGSTTSNVLSQATTQMVTTGEIDAEALLTSAVTGGITDAVAGYLGDTFTDVLNEYGISDLSTGSQMVDDALQAMGNSILRQGIMEGDIDVSQVLTAGLFTTLDEVSDFLFPNATPEEAESLWNNKLFAEQRDELNAQLSENFNTTVGGLINSMDADTASYFASLTSDLSEQLTDEGAWGATTDFDLPETPTASQIALENLRGTSQDLSTYDNLSDDDARRFMERYGFSDEDIENYLSLREPPEVASGLLEWSNTGMMADPDMPYSINVRPDTNEYFIVDPNGNYKAIGQDDAEALMAFEDANDWEGFTKYMNDKGIAGGGVIFGGFTEDGRPILDGEDYNDWLSSRDSQPRFVDVEFVGDISESTIPEPEVPEPELTSEPPPEPELTPEPPPEPEPEPEPEPVDPTETTTDQQQAPGEAGIASPSPDPTLQDDPSFAPAIEVELEPEPASARTPQQEAPITTGMFQEYFPEPAPTPAPAPSASAPPPSASGTATGTTPESSAPAVTSVGAGSGMGVATSDLPDYEQGSLIGDARGLIEQALLRGVTPEYLQQNFPQYSDLVTEVNSELQSQQSQQALATTNTTEITDATSTTDVTGISGTSSEQTERRDLQQAIINVEGDINQLDENTRQQFEEFGGNVNDLFSDVNVDIEALRAGQISQEEAQQAFQQSTEQQFGELGGQVGDLGEQLGALSSDVSGIGRGIEGIGEGISGIGEGVGAGLLGLAAQQAMLPGQIAAATPISPVEFEKFQRGLTRRKLADPLRIGMFTGGARSV